MRIKISRTSDCVSEGVCESSNAATPATTGAELEVPPKREVESVGDSPSAPEMSVESVPVGAANARHAPRLEKAALSSKLVVAPTVMMPGIAWSSSIRLRLKIQVFAD